MLGKKPGSAGEGINTMLCMKFQMYMGGSRTEVISFPLNKEDPGNFVWTLLLHTWVVQSRAGSFSS